MNWQKKEWINEFEYMNKEKKELMKEWIHEWGKELINELMNT